MRRLAKYLCCTVLFCLLVSGCTTNSSANLPAVRVGIENTHSIADARIWTRDCQKELSSVREAIDALEKFDAIPTVETILEPLNDIERRIADGSSYASLMENVHPDSSMRDIAAQCTSAWSDLATRLSLSKPIYRAVNKTSVEHAPSDTQRYRHLTLQSFRLAGVDKNEAIRHQIRSLNDQITQLGQEFDKNILEDVRYIEVDVEDLAGLPEDFIAAKVTQSNGKIRLSTRYVDTIPVYTYVHSDELRRQLRQLDRSRGYPQNEEILSEILALRYQLAQLLGFDSFADLITNDKMIGSAKNARAFIKRIHQLAEPAAEADVNKLLQELQQIDPTATEVQRWQSSYLEELVRRKEYQIDATELRQYFPYEKVKNGIFNLVESLFDVDIRPWKTTTWHPSVEAYEMYQGELLIGRFYMDMHPRAGKYQHAAAFVTQLGIADIQVPISTLVCNFSGGSDPNELMEYAEVRTFLHEFGHLLHSLFGGHQRWARLSGIATEWDFVEAPSQMLEEWMYDRQTLQSFAINAQGEPIPTELVDRIRSAREFGEGVMTSVQIFYAALSLDYHHRVPGEFSLLESMLELEKEYSPFPHQPDTYFFANLGHLNSYSALYYTYMWSKVIAVDLFSEFEAKGLWDRETAMRYRDKILAPAGSKPAEVLITDFLGRPYKLDTFADRLKPDPK